MATKSRLDSYATEPLGASVATGASAKSKPPKPVRRHTTLKLSVKTRQQIFAEVSRRKGAELPNRTIQGVIEDAVARLVGES